MKMVHLFRLAFLAGMIYSCNDAGTHDGYTDAEQKNIDASRGINRAFETANPAIIDSFVAEDFVDHNYMGPMNRDSLKAMVAKSKQDIPDMKGETIEEMAKGDYVLTVMKYSGTSQGQMGMPVGPFEMDIIHRTRFKDGKAVEHWEYMLYSDVMKMMSPGAKGATVDTTKR